MWNQTRNIFYSPIHYEVVTSDLSIISYRKSTFDFANIFIYCLLSWSTESFLCWQKRLSPDRNPQGPIFYPDRDPSIILTRIYLHEDIPFHNEDPSFILTRILLSAHQINELNCRAIKTHALYIVLSSTSTSSLPWTCCMKHRLCEELRHHPTRSYFIGSHLDILPCYSLTVYFLSLDF